MEPPSPKEPINWSLCALCQESKKENLVCPARKPPAAGYKYVAENLEQFQEMGHNPLDISLSRLDEGNGFESAFREHSASWHKSCFSKVSTIVLDRKRKQRECSSAASPVKTRRATGTSSAPPEQDASEDMEAQAGTSKKLRLCFFCNKPATYGDGVLHEAWTTQIHHNVYSHAVRINDSTVLRKLANTDMTADDCTYHLKCLTRHYRKKPKHQEDESEDETTKLQAVALAQVVAYIESCREDPESRPLFYMSDLCELYASRLKDIGLHVPDRVHSGRLRDKLLAAIPDLFSAHEGRNVVLMFNKDLGAAMKEASTRDSEAVQLARAAELVRKEIFKYKQVFNGRFQEECQEKSVPAALKALVALILNGPAAVEHPDSVKSSQKQAVLTIAQLLSFNCRKFSRKEAKFYRRDKDKETPLPIYLSLKVHAETRKKELVDTLSSMGMGISYKRLITISSQVGNAVIKRFENDGVVVPTSMMKGAFTVGVVDNIDHNPSSTTASDSFHGTGISLIQYKGAEDDGQQQPVPVFDPNDKSKGIPPLPEKYTTVLPATVSSSELCLPKFDGPHKPEILPEVRNHQEEYGWLETVCKRLGNTPTKDTSMETPTEDTSVENTSTERHQTLSWAAYHASQRPHAGEPKAIIRLLPLLVENAHSTAMIKHVMDLMKEITNFLNARQTPVLAMDQPLYAIAKAIQWNWPGTYGEENLVVMMGAFHVEQAALRTLGDWMKGSGWVSALTAAGVASSGVAESFLKVSHVTRARHAHQVTAAALYILQRQAFDKYAENPEHRLSFVQWKSERANRHPQFAYWALVLEFELSILQLVRSLRTGDFKLYMQCLSQLLPWFFALDHANYARWLSVHVRDLTMLEKRHPSTFVEFWAGGFVARKTKRPFSAIALDQAHEQCNAVVKGDGGAVGLTNDPSALRRWMVSGPEISRMVEEFEKQTFRGKAVDTEHHEQSDSFQVKFSTQVNELIMAMEEMGNPFIEDTDHLFALDTKDIMSEDVIDTVRGIVQLGQEQYNKFIEERFLKAEKPVSETIPRNKLALFSNHKLPSPKSTSAGVLKLIKSDMALFARLYIACQTRGGNLQEFFRHENQPWPPSLARLGGLRSGNKSDLVLSLKSQTSHRPLPAAATQLSDTSVSNSAAVASDLPEVPAEVMDDTADFLFDEDEDTPDDTDDLLEEAVLVPVSTCSPEVDAKVLDGAAIVQMLSPKLARTFQDYVDLVFLPYVQRQFENASRVDIVWDVYRPDSLKASTRERRGHGVRRKVSPSTQLPTNWKGFLRDDNNKTDFFHFIATSLAGKNFGDGKKLITTSGDKILSNKQETHHHLEPCSHEEADTRVILHAADCARSRLLKVLIRTTDTDVLVLAIAHFHKIEAAELWVAFGSGKTFQYIPAHDIADFLGPEKAWALLAFHAFTGCDTVSFFAGRGKKTAWSTWKTYPEATQAFLAIMDRQVTEDTIAVLQRFVVLMYDRSSTLTTVDAARQTLFARNSKSLENIPPTEAALRQHILRTVLQSGHVWGQSLKKDPHLPSPANWGWQRKDTNPWMPIWTTLEPAQDACNELIKCGCKQGCRGRCSCRKANLPCTALCFCSGDCSLED